MGANMKKIFRALVIMAGLAGCTNGNDSPTYPRGSDSYEPHPTNPTYTFEESDEYKQIAQNKSITGMYIRNADQVADYIDYRLNEWDTFNPGVGKNISKIDIANAALYLTNDELDASAIKSYFDGKTTLFHMAVYVVNNLLNRCFDTGVDSAKCFVEWRDKNQSAFDTIANEINNNTSILTADDIILNTADNDKLTFLMNNDGVIIGVKMTDSNDENPVKFDNWVAHNANPNFATLQQFTYSSYGRNLGLKYSDFGDYVIETTKYDELNDKLTETNEKGVFAGGHTSKMIDEKNIELPTNSVQFEGQSTMLVTSDRGDTPEQKLFRGGTTLDVYKDGTVNFNANFNGWYDVHAQKKLGENNVKFKFDNYTGYVYSQNFQFESEQDRTAYADGTLDIKYYGPNPENGIPTEAAGFANVDQGAGGIKMDMAFGVKR